MDDDAIAFCVIVLFIVYCLLFIVYCLLFIVYCLLSIVYLRERAQREFIARGKFITRDKKNGRMSSCVSPW